MFHCHHLLYRTLLIMLRIRFFRKALRKSKQLRNLHKKIPHPSRNLLKRSERKAFLTSSTQPRQECTWHWMQTTAVSPASIICTGGFLAVPVCPECKKHLFHIYSFTQMALSTLLATFGHKTLIYNSQYTDAYREQKLWLHYLSLLVYFVFMVGKYTSIKLPYCV